MAKKLEPLKWEKVECAHAIKTQQSRFDGTHLAMPPMKLVLTDNYEHTKQSNYM